MRCLVTVLVVLLVASCAFADDIVTMPTANQLRGGEVDAALYYIGVDNAAGAPPGAPEFVQYQTLYVGLTDWLEIDAHRAAVDNDETSTILVGTIKLLSETPTLPDVVVGCRNIGGTPTTKSPLREKSKDQSYFVSLAKTFFVNPEKPGPPLFRVHLSAGTPDWTLFGDRRHDGIFGGLQMLLQPDLGLVALHDGEDVITGVTWVPKNSGLTLKTGTYGPNWWVGLALRKAMNF